LRFIMPIKLLLFSRSAIQRVSPARGDQAYSKAAGSEAVIRHWSSVISQSIIGHSCSE
jgi:hypothetical protein